MMNGRGDLIVVESTNKGLSLELTDGNISITPESVDTHSKYTAEEIRDYNSYSLSSDIYALGKILKEDLKLAAPNPELATFVERMIQDNPNNRPTIEEVVDTLSTVYEDKYALVSSKQMTEEERGEAFALHQRVIETKNQQVDELKAFMDKNPTKTKNPFLRSKEAKQYKQADRLYQILILFKPSLNDKLDAATQLQKELSGSRFPLQKPSDLEEIVNKIVTGLRIDLQKEQKSKPTRPS